MAAVAAVTAAVAAIAVAAAGRDADAPARAARPPRCPAGAFAVTSPAPPLLPDGGGAAVTVTASAVRLGGSCGPATARVRRTRRFTRVTATWLACERLAGKVRIRARIDAETCREMTGDVSAPRLRLRRRFTAVRTRGGLAGRLVPPPAARADVDTADLGATPDNDRTAAAQPLDAPGTVGGAAYHLSDADRDDDVYALELDGRPLEAVLRIADPVRLDLDLLLLDADLREIAASRGDGSSERLVTVDESGPAYLVVFAYRGPFVPPGRVPWTAYALALRRGTDAAATGEDDDVGPVHLELRDADAGTVLQRARTGRADGWRLAFPEPIPPGRYHVVAGTDRDGDGVADEAGEAVARTDVPAVVDANAVVLLALPLREWSGTP